MHRIVGRDLLCLSQRSGTNHHHAFPVPSLFVVGPVRARGEHDAAVLKLFLIVQVSLQVFHDRTDAVGRRREDHV